jgi:hypothetical protein
MLIGVLWLYCVDGRRHCGDDSPQAGLESTELRSAGSSTKGKIPKLYVAMLVDPAFK